MSLIPSADQTGVDLTRSMADGRAPKTSGWRWGRLIGGLVLATVILAAVFLVTRPGFRRTVRSRSPAAQTEIPADSVGRLLRSLADRALALLPDSARAEAVALGEKFETADYSEMTEPELARLRELNMTALSLLPSADRDLWNRLVAAVNRQYASQEFPATGR